MAFSSGEGQGVLGVWLNGVQADSSRGSPSSNQGKWRKGYDEDEYLTLEVMEQFFRCQARSKASSACGPDSLSLQKMEMSKLLMDHFGWDDWA